MPLLLLFFLYSFYIVVSSVFRGRGNCGMVPPLETLGKIRDRLKGKALFRDYDVLGRKLDKTGRFKGKTFFLEITIFWDEKLIEPG